MEKPYIISGEFDLASNPQNEIIQLNKLEAVRESLVSDLESIGKRVVWAPAQALARGMNTRLSESNLPVVALDEFYTAQPDARIGISRGIDANFNDRGYTPRVGYKAIIDQFDAIARLGSEIQLVDDVVFSGEMAAWVVEELIQRNVKVGRVVCGIAIDEGAKRLETLDLPVDAVYSFEDVDDELCERDLFVAKGSGRRFVDSQSSALYFDTENGLPEQWASIPAEDSASFCLGSLERSLTLLQPDVPISEIGAFYGYRTEGTAIAAIRARVEGVNV